MKLELILVAGAAIIALVAKLIGMGKKPELPDSTAAEAKIEIARKKLAAEKEQIKSDLDHNLSEPLSRRLARALRKAARRKSGTD